MAHFLASWPSEYYKIQILLKHISHSQKKKILTHISNHSRSTLTKKEKRIKSLCYCFLPLSLSSFYQFRFFRTIHLTKLVLVYHVMSKILTVCSMLCLVQLYHRILFPSFKKLSIIGFFSNLLLKNLIINPFTSLY